MIEYKVRPVVRYVVTRYSESDEADGSGCMSCGSESCGEFDSERQAYKVAYALCSGEHRRAGTPVGDPGFKYPEHPDFNIHDWAVGEG